MNDPNSWKNLAYCNPARNDEGESNVDWCHGVRQGSATGSTLPLYLMSPQAATTSAKNALNGMGTNLGISPFGWSSESYAHSSMPPLPSTIISTTMITKASNERKEVTLDGEEEEAASKKSKDNLEKKGSKKRKTQQMFSVDIPGTESQSFGTKTTGEAKLTTNTPREIEVRTPNDGILIHVYKSCSECARSLNVNRSKLSRVCRSGGGLIGRFHYQVRLCMKVLTYAHWYQSCLKSKRAN